MFQTQLTNPNTNITLLQSLGQQHATLLGYLWCNITPAQSEEHVIALIEPFKTAVNNAFINPTSFTKFGTSTDGLQQWPQTHCVEGSGDDLGEEHVHQHDTEQFYQNFSQTSSLSNRDRYLKVSVIVKSLADGPFRWMRDYFKIPTHLLDFV